MQQIRNFCIIAHIDHGKSTLADRMLEITGTVEARKMQNQMLDSMELERERGITIKMQPVRMVFQIENSKLKIPNSEFILNLIDTPGHIDFSYEVSRALKAVEGAILLVDSTQGIQAQTLSVLNMAREEKLVILPVITKIDSPLARIEEVKKEIATLLNCSEESILEVSGKTGEGVERLLQEIVAKIPAPENARVTLVRDSLQALVFDFKYSTHRGVIVFVRIMSGQVKQNERLIFRISDKQFSSLEVGIFHPEEKAVDSLGSGEIGYIVTGMKEAGAVSVGDTVGRANENLEPLPGYGKPSPVVWASIYPEDQSSFTLLRQSLLRLKLSDSSLAFEEEASSILGKGFRCGFLGMLHLEIISERLKREFNLNIVITSPSIMYEVQYKNLKKEKIFSPAFFPDDGLLEKVLEPWVKIKIIIPSNVLGEIMPLLYEHECEIESTQSFGEDRNIVIAAIPLRELMRNFFDRLKSQSSGFASLSYEILGERTANVVRLDILINEEVVPAFSRVVSKRIVEDEAKRAVARLAESMPRQMIQIKIQAKALGRIISSETLSAFRKDVTQHMYGGDITRKMKLREKQKKGKKRMQIRGSVNIPQDVFLKMIKPD